MFGTRLIQNETLTYVPFPLRSKYRALSKRPSSLFYDSHLLDRVCIPNTDIVFDPTSCFMLIAATSNATSNATIQ